MKVNAAAKEKVGGTIVGAAQACDCTVLLTEDLQHDQLFGELRVVNPFATPDRSPAAVLEALEA